MTADERMENDLRYVKEVVERAGVRKTPSEIFYLWAGIVLVGDVLLDVAPQVGGTFWMIASPIGFFLSGYLGYRWHRRRGQVSARDGVGYALHWLGTMIALFLGFLLVAGGLMQPEGLPALILLILALGYFTAGLYQARGLLWVGIVIAASYVAVVFIQGPVWTFVGIVTAASLAVTGWIGGRRERG